MDFDQEMHPLKSLLKLNKNRIYKENRKNDEIGILMLIKILHIPMMKKMMILILDAQPMLHIIIHFHQMFVKGNNQELTIILGE
jgi:hypothetical protein